MVCQNNHLVFADSSNNKCYFGTASNTNGGGMALAVWPGWTGWTVYIKEGPPFPEKKFSALRHN